MKRVLIVEDDDITREMYKVVLVNSLPRSAGLIVEFASNGREASRLLEAGPYDLSIVDLALPGINGLDLVKLYRDKLGKIVVVSSYIDCASEIRKYTEFLFEKPLNLDFFMHTIGKLAPED